MSTPTLAGTVPLIRVALRRDRLLVTAWIVGLALFAYASAASTTSLFPSEAERVVTATALNKQSGLLALYGPILDVHSLGELAISKMTVLSADFAASFAIVVVRRHTRVDEESGVAELVASTAVGRHAMLVAALVEAIAASLVLGLAVALANVIGGLALAGSFVFGGLWAGTALIGVGIGAVAAQLVSSARTCALMSVGIVLVLFALRAVGDATDHVWLSWCSPLGWNTQVRAWTDPRLWVLPFYPLAAAALVGLGVWLRSRRDLGAGIFAERAGRVHAVSFVQGVLTQQVHLHRILIALWSVVVIVLGIVFGLLTPGLDDLIHDIGHGQLERDIGGSMIAAVLAMAATAISFVAITVIGHAAQDESSGRIDLVLAGPQSRMRWFQGMVGISVVASAWLMVATGIGLWIGLAIVHEPAGHRAIAAACAYIPAVWVVAALGVLLWSLNVRAAMAAFALPIVFLLLSVLAPAVHAPNWVANISPFAHVPAMPQEPFDAVAFVLLALAATLVVAIASQRFRARDLG